MEFQVGLQNQTPDKGGAKLQKVIAIYFVDFKKFGCPYCGYFKSVVSQKESGCFSRHCLHCKREFHSLDSSLKRSTILTVGGYPEGQIHPRFGAKAWLRRSSAYEIFLLRDFQRFGCPYCGHPTAYCNPLSDAPVPYICLNPECKEMFFLVDEDLINLALNTVGSLSKLKGSHPRHGLYSDDAMLRKHTMKRRKYAKHSYPWS